MYRSIFYDKILTFNLPTKYDCGNSLPSSNYIDFEFGTSGTEYIAPANGWFCARIAPTTAGSSTLVFNYNGFTVTYKSYSDGNWLNGYIPVRKGVAVGIGYTNKITSSDEYLRFFYAEGQKSIIKI